MQRISKSSAPENIDLKDTWFNPDLGEDPRKTPSHNPRVAPDNNNKTLTSPQSEPHVQEGPASEKESSSELYIYLNIIVALDYSGILYSFTQGCTGVPCPPLCALVAPSHDFFCRGLPFLGSLCRLRPSVMGWLRGSDGVEGI